MSNMKNSSAQKVITSYRKRQQRGPYIVGGFALLVIIIGIVVLVIWLTGSNKSALSFLSSATPTSTDTSTPTLVPPTPTYTQTSTSTNTATVTQTATPSGPFEYTVKSGDTCWSIASTYKIDISVLIALNPNYGASCTITPGDVILVPLANQTLPSDTPISTNLPAGTVINYTVKSGDTVRALAIYFHSTVDSIVSLNSLSSSNSINVGQVLKIAVNIATPVPTGTNTRTPGPGTVVAASKTITSTTAPSKTGAVSATP